MPVSMGVVMFVLGLAVPLLIREPAKGRYTPANKVCCMPRRAACASLQIAAPAVACVGPGCDRRGVNMGNGRNKLRQAGLQCRL